MIGQTRRRRSVDIQSQTNVKIVGPTSCMALWYHISELQCPFYFLQNLNNILKIRIQLNDSVQNYQRLTDPPARCMNPFQYWDIIRSRTKGGSIQSTNEFLLWFYVMCLNMWQSLSRRIFPHSVRPAIIDTTLFFSTSDLFSSPAPCRKYTMHLQIPTKRSCLFWDLSEKIILML